MINCYQINPNIIITVGFIVSIPYYRLMRSGGCEKESQLVNKYQSTQIRTDQSEDAIKINTRIEPGENWNYKITQNTLCPTL